MKICDRCGVPISGQTKYCPQCGNRIDLSGSTNNQQENKRITIGLSCGISILFLLLFLVFVYGVESDDILYNNGKNEKNLVNNTSGTSDEEKATLSFTSDIYEIEIHKDVNMSEYLQYSGMALDDVKWSSTSDGIYVGSDGHVSINDNGVSCSLIAVSKLDDTVKTECIVKTRTEEEDLVYQVETLNNKQVQDEKLSDGVVRLAYDMDASQMIDMNAINVEPPKRDKKATWDKTLFYRLEDVDVNSDNDGQINSYFIEKKKFINKTTDNEVEYEIYHNPDTNMINKIVSIEYEDKKLIIFEYYYTDDGKINFIYNYEDVNYAPSYATPNRDGERYLFHNDSLVTWRVVEDGEEMNYCAGKAEKSRLKDSYHDKVKVYSDCDKDTQITYDNKEKEMLNFAYNTLDKMLNNEGISKICGYVNDSFAEGLEGTTVQLMSENYNNSLYSTSTDENGFYEIMIPTRYMDYSLVFNKENYLEENIYEIKADMDNINLVQEMIYLAEQDEKEYSCYIDFYDALNQTASGMKELENLDIFIRDGVNNRSGEIIYEKHISDSSTEINLKPGMYTVQMSKSGYLDSYQTLFVSGDTANELEIYATPKLADDEYRIVLTWDAQPKDLDSHLFTPSNSDDYHICFYNMSDEYGNVSLDVDDVDGYGPETTTIYHIQNGLYKFYVCDFTNCSYGDEESDMMSNSSATVRVYGKSGLIETFHVPVRQNGVIWEVFEIRDGTIISNQRYYDSIGNKTWWNVDK